MKYICYFFFSFIFTQALYADNLATVLDTIISEKTVLLSRDFRDIKNVVYKINSRIKKDVTVQEMQDFLRWDSSAIKIFIEKLHLKKNDNVSDEVWQQAQADFQELKEALGIKLYFYYLACCKQKMLYKAVQNYNAITYWHNEQFAERLPFYQKAASRWFSMQSYHDKISENLTHLEEIGKSIHGFLGLALHNEKLLLQAKSHDEFFQSLRIAAQHQHNFLYDQKSDVYEHEEVGTILKISLAQLEQFSKDLEFHYAHCQLPSHLERHWQIYVTLAVILAASGFTYEKYGADIAQGMQNFYYGHVQGPLNRGVETFWKGVEGPKLDTAQNRKNANAMMEEMLKQPAPRKKGNPLLAIFDDLSRLTRGASDKIWEEIKGIVIANPFTWRGNMMVTTVESQVKNLFQENSGIHNEVQEPTPQVPEKDAWIKKLSYEEKKELSLERIHTIKQHSWLNIGDTYDARSLELELKMIEVQDVINAGLKDAYVIFGLATLIPVVLLGAGSFFTSRKIYHSVAYQPIRKFVRELEVELTSCLYEKASFVWDGKVYFITEQLRLHVPVLTLQEQKLMYSDIDALQSCNLNYQQKFHVIERMYRTYPCLTTVTLV